jgi:hypothetical protein
MARWDKLLPSEHQIMSSIIDLLRYQGYLVWRQNVGGTKYTNKAGKEKYIAFGQAGMSDVFAIQPQTGRFVAIEIKTPARRKLTTRLQEDFLQNVRLHGGIAFVATHP